MNDERIKNDHSIDSGDLIADQLMTLNETLKQMDKKISSMSNSIGLIAFVVGVQFFGAIALILIAGQGIFRNLKYLF